MPIIATAGWAIPKKAADQFAVEGSGLTRYASVFDGVEVNSTFYRRHKKSTFDRWANSVPDHFRFAVKMPSEITHARAMKEIDEPFRTFLDDIAPLERKRGPLLCQLPPSLPFDAHAIDSAFKAMRNCDGGRIVIEARHKSWRSPEAMKLLTKYAFEPVFADPSSIWQIKDFDTLPSYVRLHGKPKIYYSDYANDEIRSFSNILATDSWCVFDNTASAAAIGNALTMKNMTRGAHCGCSH